MRFIVLFVLLGGHALTGFGQNQSGQVKANGITIAYESFGPVNKPTILLIAGTNAQLTMWPVALCDDLVKRGYRVIRFDNRDIGLSTKMDKAGAPNWAGIIKALQEKTPPPLPYTLDDMAADAVGLLDALTISKAHIVGASMGGMIAQRVAYNHPEHTLSLTIIMSGGGRPDLPVVAKPEVVGKIPPPGLPTDTTANLNREIASTIVLAGTTYPPDSVMVRKQVMADFRRSYYPDGFGRQGAASLAGYHAGRTDQLKTIKVPTLVIHGNDDPLVPIEAGRDVAATIPGARFELVNGMGHGFPSPLLSRLATLIADNAAKAR
ncbi:alpha/beta fold hydrolase [Spirosoma pomorum]